MKEGIKSAIKDGTVMGTLTFLVFIFLSSLSWFFDFETAVFFVLAILLMRRK